VKIEGIDVEQVLETARTALQHDTQLSPTLRSAVEILLILVTVLLNRITLDSRNSSIPPSQDRHRTHTSRRGETGRTPGGQPGRKGVTLMPVANPDEVHVLSVDRGTLPQERCYREVGYDLRQVIDLDINMFVTEYRAQILEDDRGARYVATFPDGVTRNVQYGRGVKSHAVYLSQFQLIPYERVRDLLEEQLGLPISVGSLYNFIEDAYERLAWFEPWIKERLVAAALLHADETGINLSGHGYWLHSLSTTDLTLYTPHAKRGAEAMDDLGVIPRFRGILCHDHWKPYYRYPACTHSLCNAHHLRELERAIEQDGQSWAGHMKTLLVELNCAVTDAGGRLPPTEAESWRKRYRAILSEADRECPPPVVDQQRKKKGRIKRSKSRNLLERLRDFENDTLRFMDEVIVPFTNNQGENDLRMTKVQQKISGCFRSLKGAEMFCRIRSYLSTCRKQGMTATEALALLFRGERPAFAQ
jgi:transposase